MKSHIQNSAKKTQAANLNPPIEARTEAAIASIQVPRRFVANEWGGTETTILNCSRALIANGHPTQIYTSLALSDQPDEHLGGVPVRRFSYSYPYLGLSPAARHSMDKKGGNMVSLALLAALLRAPEVDLFHAHTGKRMGGIVRTAARMRKRPYVVSLHGGFFDIPQAQRMQISQHGEHGLEWGKAVGALLGSRRVLEDAAAIICVGANEYAAARAALPNKRIELLPNGVDCDYFGSGDAEEFRRHFAIAPKRRIILCVSRIDSQKNQLALVDAMPGVLRKHPSAQLVMLGPVTDACYQERIEQQISQLAIADHVTWIPGMKAENPLLRGAYHAADAFCLPSVHEPFGIVILEAWAAGLPVIASRVGGIPSFTSAGEDCLHIDPEKNCDLVTQLNRVLSDNTLAARLGQCGKIKARKEYDWKHISQRLTGLYRDIINQGAAQRCA